MTDLEQLKKYMYPFYQASTDEEYLEFLLEQYTTPEGCASILWATSATSIWSGKIKSLSTGAESTTFHSLSDVIKFCASQASVFTSLDRKKRNIGSIMVGLEPTTLIGGATDE